VTPDTPNEPAPSTTAASAATAQSREAPVRETSPVAVGKREQRKENKHYTIGPRVDRTVKTKPYRRAGSDPIYRSLRIYSTDPAASVLEGSIALVRLQYEPLTPGPIGSLFEVVEDSDSRACTDEEYGPEKTELEKDHDKRCKPLDLDQRVELLSQGRSPSSSDRSFHRQMVYAVSSLVYAAFKVALGRDLSWNFDARSADEGTRLRVRPHASGSRNAWYDASRGEVSFGYYEAPSRVSGRNLPRGLVFTCLSQDVVAHEITHALVDGLRARFAVPSNPDVPAFHEAFADLIALFQHFSYGEVVKVAIGASHGRLDRARLLTDLAAQFGHTTGHGGPLRSPVLMDEKPDELKTYGHSDEPHERGKVLVTAVFEAFDTVFKRKIARHVRLATGGSGLLPRRGELSDDLKTVLAEEASKLASQFLTMCIRALDYCPPVDIEFGEFLRAVITADADLVPDDPWAYREAWLDAFRRRDIHPSNVSVMGEDALLWQAPERAICDEQQLSYAKLQFQGEPGRPADLEELRRQARVLGSLVTDPDYLDLFGLAKLDDQRAPGKLEIPCIESVRSSRRVGPAGQIVFDLVAEVTQQLTVDGRDDDSPPFEFYGGSTVIIGPDGNVRYIVAKNVLSQARMERQRAFMTSKRGESFWQLTADGHAAPKEGIFALLDTAPDAKA
jgi:hypothetical protein